MDDNVKPTYMRAAYLRGNITHDDYYGLLVDLLGERALYAILPAYTSSQWADLVAEDRRLNNVPLKLWDARDFQVRSIPVDRDALVAITGPGGWSLSDSVCVLKCAARKLAASINEKHEREVN